MENITEEQLIEVLRNMKPEEPIGATMMVKTKLKLLVKNPNDKTEKNNLGNIYKVKHISVLLNTSYKKLAYEILSESEKLEHDRERQRIAMSDEPAPTKKGWGQMVNDSLKVHNEKSYVCTNNGSVIDFHYINDDGEIVYEKDFAQFMPAAMRNVSENVGTGAEPQKVRVANYDIKNVIRFAIPSTGIQYHQMHE